MGVVLSKGVIKFSQQAMGGEAAYADLPQFSQKEGLGFSRSISSEGRKGLPMGRSLSTVLRRGREEGREFRSDQQGTFPWWFMRCPLPFISYLPSYCAINQHRVVRRDLHIRSVQAGTPRCNTHEKGLLTRGLTLEPS